jgi:hypothetical protein
MREGLYAIVGSDGRGALEANYRLEGAAPFAVVAPASEAEVCALMEYTYAMRTPCLVAGSGTYLTHLTPPERAWWLLSTRRLNRVIDYSPQDLVLTVGAGMTLQAVQELLREHRQYLPWNPALPAQATVGGIVSSNRAGSWRYRFGTPRDRLLAIRAVTPDGVAFKSGAKVVKSVAGYDIHRLLCGAWGTLAVLTEITLKVQPLPQQFEAVGWQTTWDALEPTLAELMQMPLQPDGISVVAIRGGWMEAERWWASARSESPLTRPLSSPTKADKGTVVQNRVSEAGTVFCPHPLCPPLPQGGRGGGRTAVRPYTPLPLCGRGGRTAVRPCTPLPLCGRGAGGEGYKKCGCLTRRELKRCTLVSSLRFPLQAGGTEWARPAWFPSRSGGNLKEGGIHDTLTLHARSTLFEPPPTVAPMTQPELQTAPRLQTRRGVPAPYLLLEFSGSPAGVAWQIEQLRARGYPAEPVPDATLQRVRDWLAPRRHALLLQILMRPSEVADAMALWSELPGVSALAHAGNGIVYVAADESGLTNTLLQRIRALTAKYRVLNGAGWLREQSGGELPKLTLSDGERRLMQRLKAALDERGILPDLLRG